MKVYDISRKYRVSRSTIYRKIKEFKCRRATDLWSANTVGRPIRSSKIVIEYIAKFWKNNPNPFISKDESHDLHKKLGVRINEKISTQIRKSSLRLSYKKGKSLPVGLSLNKQQQLLKCLFSAKIIPNLSKYDMLINIDESSFSRLTKLTHSWFKKGHSQKLMNIGFINSSSLITVMTTNGKVFAASTNGSVNTSIFIEVLKKLKEFIEIHDRTAIDRFMIILDNAVTHRSKKLQEYIKENNVRLAYIPPNVPELTPIEKLFAKLKHSVVRNSIGRWINWQSEEADKLFKKWIRNIDKYMIARLWSTFTFEIYSSIDFIDKEV